MGWVCAVGERAPAVPDTLPAGLPTDAQAACSPVWRDPELARIWKASVGRKLPTQRRVKSSTNQTQDDVGPPVTQKVTPAPFDAKTMLRELRVFYDANGISALNFHCKHHAICSGGSPAFITAQETYVGPDYMTGPLPRLLFLSLDSGKLKPEPEARTMEAVRQRTIARDVNDLHKGNHWYQTHALALELLAPFDPSLRLDCVVRHFAHMNSAKCCQNNPRNAQAAAVLFENCRPFIAKELELLQPDIIVSQGNHAMKAVAEGFSEPAPRLRGSCAIRIIRCGGQPALWIATYHPTARAALYENQLKTGRRAYVDAVKRFINGKDEPLR